MFGTSISARIKLLREVLSSGLLIKNSRARWYENRKKFSNRFSRLFSRDGRFIKVQREKEVAENESIIPSRVHKFSKIVPPNRRIFPTFDEYQIFTRKFRIDDTHSITKTNAYTEYKKKRKK